MPETRAAATLPAVGSAGPSAGPAWLHLRSGGVSLVLQVSSSSLPVVLHWGADLGDLGGPAAAASVAALLPAGEPDSAAADTSLPAIIPAYGAGWVAGPGLAGTHDGRTTAPRFSEVGVRLVSQHELAPGLTEVGADTLIVQAEDPVAELSLDLAVQLTGSGVVRCRAGVTNRAAERYRLDGLSLFLPGGQGATHTLELDELPVRPVPLRSGGLSVTGEPGRPAQLVLGEPWAGFRRGEVWQAHVAFSGPVTHRAEVAAEGRTYLGGGERLTSGEVVLATGEAYHSPWVLWSWGDGLDAAADRLHDELRPAEAGVEPVIFDATGPAFADHDRAAMLTLAEYAAAVGVESFLLDVGWCVRAGLDPFADHEARGHADPPDDLDGLLARIRGFDLEVGLAVELERLDPESTIARDHPEWLLESDREGVAGPVLDLSVRPAMIYVWERLTKLLDRHPVSLLSWSPVSVAGRSASAEKRHSATLAVYRLLDAVRERYPEVTLLSSAMDLAMARRAVATDRTGRLDPPASGVRLAGAAAAPGPDLAARVRRGRGCDLAGVSRRRRVLRPAGHRHGPAQAGRGQPAGDPPLAGALQGVPAVAALRPHGAFGPERQRVRRPRGGGPRSRVRRCSHWSGWSGRRGGGSGWTDWTRPRRTGSRSPGHGRWTPRR